jgi:arsenate reductase
MAEGWTRTLKGNIIDAFSAGTEAKGLNPLAVKVMKEVGVDISTQKSKNVMDLLKQKMAFDYVITVCDQASESCPLFPAKTKVIHVGFEDPPKLAKNAKTEAEALPHYRRIRDEIREFIATLPGSLLQS